MKEKWLRDIWFVRKDDMIYQIASNEDQFLVTCYNVELGSTEMLGIMPSRKIVVQQKMTPGPSKKWSVPGAYQLKELAPSLYLVKNFELEMKFVIETTKEYPSIHHSRFYLPEIKSLPKSIRRRNGTVETVAEVVQDTARLDELLSILNIDGFTVLKDRFV